jgi:hypothetical protein
MSGRRRHARLAPTGRVPVPASRPPNDCASPAAAGGRQRAAAVGCMRLVGPPDLLRADLYEAVNSLLAPCLYRDAPLGDGLILTTQLQVSVRSRATGLRTD